MRSTRTNPTPLPLLLFSKLFLMSRQTHAPTPAPRTHQEGVGLPIVPHMKLTPEDRDWGLWAIRNGLSASSGMEWNERKGHFELSQVTAIPLGQVPWIALLFDSGAVKTAELPIKYVL
jgi:hypothetical protein